MKFLCCGILLLILAFAGRSVQNENFCREISLCSSNSILQENPSNDEKNLPKKKEEKDDKEENKEQEDDRNEEENKVKDSILNIILYNFDYSNITQSLDKQCTKIELLKKWTAALVAPLYILYSDLKVNC